MITTKVPLPAPPKKVTCKPTETATVLGYTEVTSSAGFCASGFYSKGVAGSVTKTKANCASVTDCASICNQEDSCEAFSWSTDLTCSRYKSGCTSLVSSCSYTTYKRNPPPPPTPPIPPSPNAQVCPTGTLLGTSWFTTAGEQSTAPTSLICCPAECGACAGSGCGARPGGPDDCCAKKISPANKPCSSNAAPCILTDKLPA